jgi:hypothetical protein
VQRPPRFGVDPDALKRGDAPIGPNTSGGSTGRGHDEGSLTVNEPLNRGSGDDAQEAKDRRSREKMEKTSRRLMPLEPMWSGALSVQGSGAAGNRDR